MSIIDKALTLNTSCTREYLEELQKIAKEKIPEGCIVECGVGSGMSAVVLTEVAYETNRKIILCDTFCGFPAPGIEDIDNPINIKKGYNKENTTALVKKNLLNCAEFNLENTVNFILGDFAYSMEYLSHLIFDGYLPKIALLHIDCDFYDSCNSILKPLLPFCMVENAIIVVHDYMSWTGITKAVNSWFKSQDIIMLTPDSCMIKVNRSFYVRTK